MGLLNLIEEVAGSVVAVQGVEKLDPNAGLVEKGMAAYAGFKGVEKLKEVLAEKSEEAPPAA